MRRAVEPELLDDLPAGDTRAVGSRADLRRLNFIMGHACILSRVFRHHVGAPLIRAGALRLVELGGGDGTLLLRLARSWSPLGVIAQVRLLDRQDLVSADTRRAFGELYWSVENVMTDVLEWLAASATVVDVMLANLFVHHFPDERLRTLLRLAAARTNLFIACEPRRSALALFACRWLRLIGCNGITRHDALVSVRAGFEGTELSALWPGNAGWTLSERSVGPFSHCFVAQRNG